MTFTPERIAATREILAKHNPEAVSCAMDNFPAALDEIERLSAELSRLKAELDEAVGLLAEAKAVVLGTRSIVSQGGMTGFNWQDGDWLEKLFVNQRALSSFLSRMEGRK